VKNRNAHDSSKHPSNRNKRLKPKFRYFGMVRVAGVLRLVKDKQSLLATWIKCFQNNPLAFSSIILFVAYFLGAVNLGVFSWFIGRPDVFMQSLEVGPGLLAVMVSGLLPLLMIIGGLVIPSLFFALPVKYLELNEGSARKIAGHLFAIFASGMVVFVVVSELFGGRLCLLTVVIIPFLVASCLVEKYAKKMFQGFLFGGY